MRWIVTAAALAALTIGVSPGSRDVSAKTRYIGSDHIVSWETLPDQTGQMCLWPEDSSYQARGGAAPAQASAVPSFSKPDRVIRDRYPSFMLDRVDLARDHVVVTDGNLFQVMFFNRPRTTPRTRWPRRCAHRHEVGRIADVARGVEDEDRVPVRPYIDPRNGDFYA